MSMNSQFCAVHALIEPKALDICVFLPHLDTSSLAPRSRTEPNWSMIDGTTNMLSTVEVTRPKRMTTAMGAWISLPGSPLASASGKSPSPEASAVIRIGASRSDAPWMTA